MCGIAGWISYRQNVAMCLPTMVKMTRRLTSRGPDSEGYYSSEECLLGHRRLAVVDLRDGTQPMKRTFRGKHYVIVYNGELYNTEDLRKELQKDMEFTTHSDTEVVLAAYCRWGKEAPQKLLGIFAFGVWCEEEKELFLARDQMGVKPLFYALRPDGILFGSEIKAILAHPGSEATLSADGVMQLLGLGPARTLSGAVYDGICELPPASMMTVNREGERVFEYWTLKAQEHTDSYEETKEKVRTLFTDAVRRQLVSDVPLCTFLSGGLDSSAISAVASEEARKKGEVLTTYSIHYEENDKYFKASLFQPDSDSNWVDFTSDAIGSRHRKVYLDSAEVADALKESMCANDLPGMADVDSSLYLFCREIKKDFKVALSGECADEIFGGYPWFTNEDMIFSSTFPWARSVEERTAMLGGAFKNLPLGEYVNSVYEDAISTTPRLSGEGERAARLRKISWLNQKWFMRTLLSRKDRMSMAWGLEVRVPFADVRLAEYAYNIPMEMKYHGGREKGLLREAFCGLLPEKVLWRKKSPYPKSHHPIYFKKVKERLGDLYDTPSARLWELIDRSFVKEFLATDGENLKRNFYGQLMTAPQTAAYLLEIEDWLRIYRVKIKN